MLGKVNVVPIISGHVRTLRSGDAAGQSRILKRDMLLFYVVPAGAAAWLTLKSIVMPGNFVDFLVITFTIFIPLLANVLFSIFTIQDRPAAQADPAAKALLADIYRNLSYTIVVAFAAVVLLGLTKLIGQPRALDLPEQFWKYFDPFAEKAIWWGAYFLTIHLALTLLMIVKRTHVLLGTQFLSRP